MTENAQGVRTLWLPGLILLLVGGAYVSGQFFSEWSSQKRASALVAECKQNKEKSLPSCYEREIVALMDRGSSMAEAAAVTREVLALDPTFRYCHVVAHKLAAKEVAKDPLRWREIATEAPLDICSYGFLHGAFQAHFRKESFPPETSVSEIRDFFSDLCTGEKWKDRTSGEQANCTHALGHLLLYVTNADLHKASAVCAEFPDIATYDVRRACTEGVFMQLYQPLEPDDFALVEGKTPTTIEERNDLCMKFSGMTRALCIKESWPLERQVLRDPRAFERFCIFVGGGDLIEEEYCVSALSYMVAASTQFDVEAFGAFCTGMPHMAGLCLGYGAPRFLEVYQDDISGPLALCGRAHAIGEGSFCYNLLATYSTWTFEAGSPTADRLCDSLPIEAREACSQK